MLQHWNARPQGFGRHSSLALDLTEISPYPPTRTPNNGSSRVAKVPDDLTYTKDHEYVARTNDPGVVRVGITDYAQGELGDVVFVNLPKPGDKLDAHQSFGTIEAVKAVSELYSPIAGEVVEVNGAIESDPAVVNRDPYGEGWMVKLKPSNPTELSSLLSPSAYRSHIGE
jgi:glycine cleavage system H protein